MSKEIDMTTTLNEIRNELIERYLSAIDDLLRENRDLLDSEKRTIEEFLGATASLIKAENFAGVSFKELGREYLERCQRLVTSGLDLEDTMRIVAEEMSGGNRIKVKILLATYAEPNETMPGDDEAWYKAILQEHGTSKEAQKKVLDWLLDPKFATALKEWHSVVRLNQCLDVELSLTDPESGKVRQDHPFDQLKPKSIILNWVMACEERPKEKPSHIFAYVLAFTLQPIVMANVKNTQDLIDLRENIKSLMQAAQSLILAFDEDVSYSLDSPAYVHPGDLNWGLSREVYKALGGLDTGQSKPVRLIVRPYVMHGDSFTPGLYA